VQETIAEYFSDDVISLVIQACTTILEEIKNTPQIPYDKLTSILAQIRTLCSEKQYEAALILLGYIYEIISKYYDPKDRAHPEVMTALRNILHFLENIYS
jgi:hypothetical protein